MVGIGLPSAKLSFNPTSIGESKTLPLDKIVKEMMSERQGIDPDINQEKAGDNLYFSQYGYTTGEEVIQHCRDRIKEVEDKTGRKCRSDCIPLVSTILKPNSLVMEKLSKEEQIKLLKDLLEEAQVSIGKQLLQVKTRDRKDYDRDKALEVGKKATVVAAFHLDEYSSENGNPAGHIHLAWEPIMEKDGLPYMNISKVHGRDFLRNLNREIVEGMLVKDYKFDKSFDFLMATDEEKEKRIALKKAGKIKSGQSSFDYKLQKKAEEYEIRQKQLSQAQQKLKETQQKHEEIVQKNREIVDKQKDAYNRNKPIIEQQNKDIARQNEKLKQINQEIKSKGYELKTAQQQIEKVESSINEDTWINAEIVAILKGKYPSIFQELWHLAKERLDKFKEKIFKKPVQKSNEFYEKDNDIKL